MNGPWSHGGKRAGRPRQPAEAHFRRLESRARSGNAEPGAAGDPPEVQAGEAATPAAAPSPRS